jgi:hypothetical protein
MAPTTDLQREIAAARSSLESRVVELRERSRRTFRQASRRALVVAGVGAAVGVVAVGVFVAYRVTRPATPRERLNRVVPPWLPLDVRDIRSKLQKSLGGRVPPVRLYIGDKLVGEQPPAPRWEKLAIRVVQAAAAAGGTALARHLLQGLRPGQPRP